jgi:SpoVK/Ycf46/Vps4 family AAA+-type ATPase
LFESSKYREEPTIEDFGELLQPKEAAEPILAKSVRGALIEWLTEIFAEKALIEAKLKPRKKALFTGKPGTGKTTLAHHLSARLGLAMLVVRPERLISKWVGQTAMQIGELFDVAKRCDPPVVLFMDEFDAVASQRTDAQQASDRERNAYVNTLLQRIEQHDGFIITATNFANHIDPAIWRRFDVHIEIDLPGQFERERILARYLEPFGLPKADLKRLAEAMSTASPSLMRQFVEGLKRQMVIGPMVNWDMRRDATIERLLAAIQPHPDLGKPRLWTHGAKDAAIAAMTWPLPKAADVSDAVPPADGAPVDTVVPFPRSA